MLLLRRHRTGSGLTLIEVLCTITIIMILAGLVLGPATRVLRKLRADQGRDRVSARLQDSVEQLRRHLVGQPAFGVVTLERVVNNRWVGVLESDFLRDSRVTFIPFADSDPDSKVVIQVRLERGYWCNAEIQTRTKADLTHEPQ